MTIPRTVLNTFCLLNLVRKIANRQVKNPYPCVATCFYTLFNIRLPYLSINYYYRLLLLNVSSSPLYPEHQSCVAWGQEGRCGTRPHRSISARQVFKYLRGGHVTAQIYIADKLHHCLFSAFHNFNRKIRSNERSEEEPYPFMLVRKLNKKLT